MQGMFSLISYNMYIKQSEYTLGKVINLGLGLEVQPAGYLPDVVAEGACLDNHVTVQLQLQLQYH